MSFSMHALFEKAQTAFRNPKPEIRNPKSEMIQEVF